MTSDLSSAEAVDRLIAEVRRRDLRIDILINDAGLGVVENFLDTTFCEPPEHVGRQFMPRNMILRFAVATTKKLNKTSVLGEAL